MESASKLDLVDRSGRRLSAHIEDVLQRLLPRLRRSFPALTDDVQLTEILEEAGQRIAEHEERSGPIERLYGYAWAAVRNAATSRMRRFSTRLAQATLDSKQSEKALSFVQSTGTTPEQIESEILFHEVLGELSAEEKLVCIWKKAGFSSREIAEYRGSSVVAVDTLFCRAKDKIRRALGVDRPDVASQRRAVEQTSKIRH